MFGRRKLWAVGAGLVLVALLFLLSTNHSDLFFEKHHRASGRPWRLDGHPDEEIIEVGTSKLAGKSFGDGRFGAYSDAIDGLSYLRSKRGNETIVRWGEQVTWSWRPGDAAVTVRFR